MLLMRYIYIKSILFAVCFVLKTGVGLLANQSDYDLKSLFDNAHAVSHNYLDSGLTLFQNVYELAVTRKDTTYTIKSLQEMSAIYLRLLNKSEALKTTSEALTLAKMIEDTVLQHENLLLLAEIHRKVHKFPKAIQYGNEAIYLAKECFKRGRLKQASLMPSYYGLALTYTAHKEYDSAMTYIDSCYYMASQIKVDSLHFGNIEVTKASILASLGKVDQARQMIFRLRDYYESQQSRGAVSKTELIPLINIYLSLGRHYSELKDYGQAIRHYHLSLKYIDQCQSHFQMKEYIHKRLSVVYKNTEMYDSAYYHLGRSNAIYKKWHGFKNEDNVQLIDIRNTYLEEIEKKERALLEQQLLTVEREKSILILRVILLVAGLVIVISSLIILNRRIRRKQRELKAKNKEREKRNSEVIELKNRELTSYTLLLIEKEEILEKAANFMKKHSDDSEARALLKTMKMGGTNIWEEFNQRFSAVNQGFYDKLRAQYPDLSSTNIKHCALIKLNFTSKEMAYLLGISERGVFTSRYRIRKKMNLDTDVNLTEYLNKL